MEAEAVVRPIQGLLIVERDDDALITAPHWQFGNMCIARRPKLMSNEEWRPMAERIVAALSASPPQPQIDEGIVEARKRLQWIIDERYQENADLDTICTYAQLALAALGTQPVAVKPTEPIGNALPLLAALTAIYQRANESGTGEMGLIDTIHDMCGIARDALSKAEGWS